MREPTLREHPPWGIPHPEGIPTPRESPPWGNPHPEGIPTPRESPPQGNPTLRQSLSDAPPPQWIQHPNQLWTVQGQGEWVIKQGSHTFSKMKFQDFSRTYQGQNNIFQAVSIQIVIKKKKKKKKIQIVIWCVVNSFFCDEITLHAISEWDHGYVMCKISFGFHCFAEFCNFWLAKQFQL